ncbi:MAG: hypothetical protein JWR27_499 [Aeromicrobium sp.]|nr:hypothetical protein [Aeromicrobium sp.]
MKTLVNVLLGLIAIAVVAAVVLFFTTRAAEKDANEAVGPPKAKIVYISTKGAVASIERRLTAKVGVPLVAKCPKEVSDKIGTTFRCDVSRTSDDRRLAIAEVTINGPRGQYKWTSKPAPRPTPTVPPTPA